MGNYLTPQESDDLNKRITNAEEITGAQIILAAVERCDSYAELPWKAFALGTSVAGMVVFLLGYFHKMPASDFLLLFSIIIMLAAGAVFALLTVICHPFARLFLSEHRVETEVKQYAESVFLSREMFKTESRCGLLILTSIFEKYTIILPDKGLQNRLDGEAISAISNELFKYIKRKKVYELMKTALDRITETLGKADRITIHKDELSNDIIEEKGV